MQSSLSLTIAKVTVLSLLAVVVQADDVGTLARIDKQLAELKTFRYERSGDPLRDLETTILQLPSDSPLRAKIEEKLITALERSNDIGKGIICRQLRAIGTDKCIPAVAPMLLDPKLTDAARLAIQGIGSASAAKAMHDALGNAANGDVQVGLINALAALGYEPLRSDCIRLIRSDKPEVVKAAVRALGILGGVESLNALTQLKSRASGPIVGEIDLAIIRGADKLAQAGKGQDAKEYFAALDKKGGPSRLATLRGLVEADPDHSADILLAAMRGQDGRLAMWAIDLVPRAADKDATAKFVAIFDDLSAESKILMLRSLGRRRDPVAAHAVVEATKSGSALVRQPALEALGGLSGDEAIDTLLHAAARGDKNDQRVARAALAHVGGAESRLAAKARGSNEQLAVESIRALSARKATGQSELILQLARGKNEPTRTAAIDALGVLIDPKTVDRLMKFALEDSRADDLKAIERSLSRVLKRIHAPEDRARPLLHALPDAAPRVRPMLIRQLPAAGTDEALAAVRAALQNGDAEASDAAVTALSLWPNRNAGDDLVKLIKSDRSPEQKQIALNGYLRIASESDDPSAMLLSALQQVDDLDTKKRVLDAIGLNCDSLEAVKVTQSLLNQPTLRSTAAVATIRVADRLRSSQEARARAVLENILVKVDDPGIQKQAQEVLNEIDKHEDHIMRWVAIGPFADKSILTGEQSYRTVYEPEQADTSKLQWKPLKLGIGRWEINLEANYGPLDHCCAYVRTMVWSPIDQDVQVEGGCDDALKMWVNGKLVYDQPRRGGGGPRTMLAPAKLNKGWNELKLKAVDHEGGWTFGCRIRKPNGTKLDGLKFEAR